MTAEPELLPLPEPDTHDAAGYRRAYSPELVRANLAPLQAENERLRAEARERDASLEWWGRFASRAVNARKESEDRAERLAEALRDLLNVSDKFTGDPDEDTATWVAANDAARAALEQEDRNG